MSEQEKTATKIPVPVINPETKAFWDATAEGKLLIKKCNDCGEVHYYPRTICPYCMSANTQWLQCSGKGKVYSYSIMRRAKVPYCIAYVTLAEGVTMMTNIIKTNLDDIAIDMDVELSFLDTGEGCALPCFTRA
ncbi:MAG TPA: OB-fold domain-containing protein [Pseudomonadales bacterium]